MICVKAPEFRTPSLTKNNKATVIIPLLLNPSSISFGVIIPAHKKDAATVNKIIPGRILSHINATIMPTKASNTNAISKFMHFLFSNMRNEHQFTHQCAKIIKNLLYPFFRKPNF